MGLTHLALLGPLLLRVVHSFQDPQIRLPESFDTIPDCDADFALHALALVQSKLADIQRHREIEAILASCNKPMIQKIAEASIHLLDKGVIPTPLIQQLQELSALRKKERRFRFAKVASEAPPEYKNMIHQIGSINTNDSLSGNEKLLYIQEKLFRLSPKDRLELRRILSEPPSATMAPVVPASFQPPLSTIVIPPHPFLPTAGPSIAITKQEPEKFNFSIPPSFSIGQGTDSNLLFSSRKQERELLPAREHNEHPSLFIKTVPMGVQELPSRGEGPHVFGTPISAQVMSQGKAIDMKNIDDLDLLNSRNNIWKEAAKFLETNTNIPSQIRKFLEEHGLQNGVFKGNPQILAGLSVPANTFALPAGMAEQLNKAYSGNSQTKRYLPVRQKDAIIPEVRFKGLDRFDTHLGRFSTGDPNSKAIFAQIPREQLRPRQNVPQQTTLATLTVPTTPPPVILPGGAIQVPNKASGFVQFPTYPPPPAVTVHVITTTIKPESGQVFSRTRGGEVDRFPSFPSIDTTAAPPVDPNQEFVPYRGPEEITGSRLYPPTPFNQQVGGRSRFVKIDLLNEH